MRNNNNANVIGHAVYTQRQDNNRFQQTANARPYYFIIYNIGMCGCSQFASILLKIMFVFTSLLSLTLPVTLSDIIIVMGNMYCNV